MQLLQVAHCSGSSSHQVLQASDCLHAPAALYRGSHCTAGWVDPTAAVEGVTWTRENLSASQTSPRPVPQSLH